MESGSETISSHWWEGRDGKLRKEKDLGNGSPHNRGQIDEWLQRQWIGWRRWSSEKSSVTPIPLKNHGPWCYKWDGWVGYLLVGWGKEHLTVCANNSPKGRMQKSRSNPLHFVPGCSFPLGSPPPICMGRSVRRRVNVGLLGQYGALTRVTPHHCQEKSSAAEWAELIVVL